MAEPKKILLVSYCFAPNNIIGAVRPTKLAKYLTRMGHEVTVVCGMGITGLNDPTLERDLAELKDVHVIREWNPIRDLKHLIVKYKKTDSRMRPNTTPGTADKVDLGLKRQKGVSDKIYILLAFLADRSFAYRGKRALRKLDKSFDVVLSSYGPLSVHHIASYAKKKRIAIRWLADFRDEITAPLPCLRGIANRCLADVKQNADEIMAVGGGMLTVMGLDEKGHVAPSGYDVEDLQIAADIPQQNQTLLTFVYCGQLFSGRVGVPSRTLEPFFHAVSRLIKRGICTAQEIEIVYAGKEGAKLKEQASRASLEGLIHDLGLIDRAHSLGLQRSADVLLLASWNTKNQQGLLTGKMLEYLMMNRPILCCMNGDVAQSEAKRILHRARIGFCYEQANAKDDDKAMDAYLIKLVENARSRQSLLENPDQFFLDQYACPSIVRQIAQWL